jgi:hypothetical protein
MKKEVVKRGGRADGEMAVRNGYLRRRESDKPTRERQLLGPFWL